jgi:hypothetical protein
VRAFIVIAFAAVLSGQKLSLPDILSRVSEEAEMFRRIAPQALSEETLEQRTLRPVPRFRPRSSTPATPEYVSLEIVSEYSYSAFREAPGALHEFREVISVDGLPVNTAENARHSLSLGLKSENDRARKRMLEDFRKLGLIDAAMDFGQILLLFTRRELPDYDFRMTGADRIGADEATVLSYSQRQGRQTMLVFEGRKTIRAKLDGKLWVRSSDGLPLRISVRSEWKEQRHMRRHEAVVDYTTTPFGMVAPASVKHTEYFDRQIITENLFRYSPFKRFGADAAIKFTAAPEPQGK